MMVATLLKGAEPQAVFYGIFCLFLILVSVVSPFLLLYTAQRINNKETIVGAYNSLFTIPLLFLLALTTKTVFLAGFLVCSVMSLIVVFYVTEYGHYINRNTFYVIFETNRAECQEFLGRAFRLDTYRFKFLLATVAINVSVICILPKVDPAHFHFLLGILSILILLTLLVPELRRIFIGKPRFIANGIEYEWKSAFQNFFVLFFSSLNEYVREKRKQKKLASMCPDEIEAVHTSPVRPDEEVHVLIVGESAVRTHMSIYGYFRSTTPLLQNMASELYLFREVISSHSGTIASIRDMFTFCSHEDQTDFYGRGTLLQFIRKAGFDTYWISNQCPTGYNENFATMLAQSCDTYLFLNPSEHYIFPSYDDKVIPPLKRYLSKSGPARKFVVVHLMGQHFSFANRYPKDYSRFTSTDDLKGMRGILEQINEYDNATLFNDYVVSSIIDVVKKLETHASVLYLADHGIDLFEYSDTASQSEWDGTPPMFQIPFVLWLSDKYKKNRPGFAKMLPSCLNRKFITDDLIFSLPDLLGFWFPSHDRRRSLFAGEWKFKKRIIIDGQRKIDHRDYDEDIAVIGDDFEYRRDLMTRQDEQFRKKVWAHECNSIGKLREAEQIFRGVEMDLVYDEKHEKFDVNHPPTPSIDLKIEDALAALPDPKGLKFWFDIKNISLENAERMSARLTKICSRFGLSFKNIIVESMVAGGLLPFHQAGFRTSYYLPTPFLRKLAEKEYRRLNAREKKQLEKIKEVYFNSGVWSVSLDGYLVEFVRRLFPEAKRILAWYQDKSPFDHFRRMEIRELLEKERRIEVLLVQHPSKHYRP